MESATNPQTGEVVFLVNNEWVKPEQSATNPKTGERAYLVGNEWQVMPGAKPKAEPKAEPAVSNQPTLDVESLAGPTMGEAAPTPAKKESVLQNAPMPAPTQPSPISLGVDPKFVAGTHAYLDSLPREQRDQAIEDMQQRGGVYSQIASAYASKQSALDKTKDSPATRALDTRVEARTDRLTDQGLDAEAAAGQATNNALLGVPDKLAQMTATPEEVTAIQDAYGLKPGMHGYDEALRVLKRTGAKGLIAGQQGYYGVKRAMADFMGERDEDAESHLDYMDSVLKNMGESQYTPVRIFEGAASSIIQQAPAMVGGLLTGSEPLVLANMFTQSFGQTYDDSRRLGMPKDEAAARAAAYAAFEVLGEKIHLGADFAKYRAIANSKSLSELVPYYTKALTKDIPGELGTYTGQFAVDKLHGVNAEAGVSDFINGAIDTALATTMQAGLMFGGGAVANKALRAIQPTAAEAPVTPDPNLLDYVQAAQQRGFLQPVQTRTPPTPETVQGVAGATYTPVSQPNAQTQGAAPVTAPTVQPLTPGVQSTEQPTEQLQGVPAGYKESERQARVDALTAHYEAVLGLPAEDSKRMAINTVRKEEGRLAVNSPQTELPADRIEQLTQEHIDVGVAPETARRLAIQQVTEEEHADHTAEQEARAANAPAQPVSDRAGVSMAGQPGAVPTTAGAGVTEPTGVVPTRPDVGGTEGGAGAQPSALTDEASWEAKKATAKKTAQANFDAAFADVESYGSQAEALDAHRQNTLDTLQENGETDPDVLKYAADAFDRLVDEHKAKQEPQPAPAATEAGVAKTRGRPRLAPEAKAAADAARKEQRNAANAAARNVTKATDLLAEASKPLDEGSFDNEEDLKNAQDEKRKSRAAAIRTLYQLSRDNRNKPGQQAKEALKQATPRELADAKAAYELAKAHKLTKPSANRIANAPVDSGFAKAKNGAQAIARILKTGDAFQKFLAARLRGFVSNVKFVVIEQGDKLPAELEKHAKDWNNARGLYIQNDEAKTRTVYVRGESFGEDQGVNNVTVLHELLHAATNQKLALGLKFSERGYRDAALTQFVEEIDNLAAHVRDFYLYCVERNIAVPDSVHKLVLSTRGDIFTDAREFVAYGMTDPAFQDFLNKLPGHREGGFSRFVHAILKLFGLGQDKFTALSDLIDLTDKVLSARKTPLMRLVQHGMPKEQVSPQAQIPPEEAAEPAVRSQAEVDKAFKEANQKFVESKKGEDYAKALSLLQMAQHPKEIIPFLQSIWKDLSRQQRSLLVRLPTTEFLADWAYNAVPELRNTNVLLERMSGMTQRLLHGTGILTREIERAYRADPTLEAKLDYVTHTATLAEVDPADTLAKVRSKQLDEAYKGLGKEGQRLYKRIRDHFEVLSDYFGRLLDDQITNSGLPIAEQANLLKKIRSIYETKSKITPYFPLVRYGDYWLRIGTGKGRKFFMFETARERDQAMRKFAESRIAKGKAESQADYEQRIEQNLKDLLESEEYKHGDSISELRGASAESSAMLKEIFQIIDALPDTKNMDKETREALKDSVYQIYLQTMPEQSFRKQFLHRKGTIGFSTDILRGTATASTKMATQLSRLKYAPLLRNSVSQAKDSITNIPQYEPYVSEMGRRVADSLASKPPSTAESIVKWLNRLSYVWYLGGASSALLQPLSVFQTGVPVLAARYGMVGTSRELGRMMKVWSQFGVYETLPSGEKVWVAPSIEHAPGLTQDEKRAIRDMLARDVTTSTYASTAFDAKSTPRGKRTSAPIREFTSGVVDSLVLGGLMHSTERLSREIVYLASYRLSRQKGLSHEEAVNNAVHDTNEALFNYGQYNRPSFMKGATGKFLTQFMMYPVHVSLFLFKNLKEIMKPMNGRTRAEAAKKFFGTLGTTWVLGGYVALPMFSMIMGLLGAMWRHLGDDVDELKKLDFETWFRDVFMQEQLGDTKIGGHSIADILERGPANALTGMDISGRTSLNNLWARDTKEYKTVRDNAMAMALEKAGPSANMILSWAEAYEAFSQGDYQRGVQKATPAGFRNFINTYQLWKEGAKDNKGAQLLSRDAFTTGELLGQAIGFRPDTLANVQEVNFKVIGLEQRINNQRNLLLTQLKREHAAGNVEAYKGYMQKMTEFNLDHPSYQITTDELVDAIFGAAEQRATSYRGINLTQKNVPSFGKALVPSRKAAQAKEEKGRE